jgi:alkanesulfonate monooxygenase SsuD/methylene tetrahydromethanopterin reductase-like flavin-dependent oxidoreductase (luciferase family)
VLELGVFHNGASDLPPVMTPDGVVVSDGGLDEMHESDQRVIVNQVRQGILADQLGFNYFFMTEHHFQPEGVELSPSPILMETAIAARTSRIRLGQLANIISWWHPIRLAEQAAMLDVISGGRLEFGIGRGYQPRETEVLGGSMGTTVQDQERNRAFFEEAYEIIMKAWTQPSFGHHGQFFTLPPTYTRWNHKQTIAYFKRDKVDHDVNDVLHFGPPDMYSQGSPILATTTTLKEISVFPRPVQRPHPQVWMAVTSARSIDWAAERGMNCFNIVEPTSRIRANVERYYETSEKSGWPDRLDRGPLKYGWDAEKRRGFNICRYVHILQPGKEKEDLERFKAGLELQWDYYGPFGFASVLAEADEDLYSMDMRVTGDLLIEKEVAIVGTAEQVVEKILKLKEGIGYDDFLFSCWFETGGYSGDEIDEQLRMFAADCMPALAAECGGLVQNPEVQVALTPRSAAPVS